ncbi:MAG: hypothetical protein EXX96DRAFT_504273 [Benjaminiella poitrasii]|nr:MAG: hypothetical protein EXX96DRAFT_504273 [Benjaminiella poitrasii]
MQLANENELLTKRNKELEALTPAAAGLDSINVTHPLATSAEIPPVLETPALPPRSPYRINHHSSTTTTALTDLPKRPPVLKLAMSNYSRIKEQGTAAEATVEFNSLSQQIPSNPTSPRSATSGSSLTIDRQQQFFELDPTTNRFVRRSSSTTNCKSEPSTPAHPRTPRYDSLLQDSTELQSIANSTVLSNLSGVYVKIISSTTNADRKGLEAFSFLIGVLQKDDGAEIWRIEKTLADLISLDKSLKESSPMMAANLKKLPDKSLFSSHAPAKVDERKNMMDEYLQHAITLRSMNSIVLCEFLSSDRIYHLPITLTNDVGMKTGYLTKKGKNFGGWKTRYFVLDSTGILKYYESQNGQYLGIVSLVNSHILSQPPNDPEHESHYRHAFVILEPKSNGAVSKHTLCAESDEDRDAWVDALRHHTSQFHLAEEMMADDVQQHLVVEPSSSTESSRSANSTHHHLRKRPSMDYILNYFQHNNGSRRRSSNAILTSPKTAPLLDSHPDIVVEEHTTFDDKKAKHRSNRKTFWPKKMFGGGSGAPVSGQDILSSSPTALTQNGGSLTLQQDYLYMQAMSDYEETRGENQVFGIPLESAVSVSRVSDQYDLPAIVHRCLEYLEAKGALTEEGIYRLSGSAAKVKALKKRFNDFGDVQLLEDKEDHDIHAIAGLLKMWLRELPENILTESLLGDFLQIIHLDDQQDRLRQIGRLVSLLPIANYTLLRSLCAHLIRVVEHSNKNKMTLQNISIVFSATLTVPSHIFTMLLVDFDYIFWTERYDADQATEDTIKIYMQDISEDQTPVAEVHFNSLSAATDITMIPDTGRSTRNSMHYQDNTPKEVIALEKQLKATLEEDFPYDDEAYLSEGELEIAYFASRYNANNKNSKRVSNEMKTAAI